MYFDTLIILIYSIIILVQLKKVIIYYDLIVDYTIPYLINQYIN
jgi:hypothetical protein